MSLKVRVVFEFETSTGRNPIERAECMLKNICESEDIMDNVDVFVKKNDKWVKVER